MIQLSVKKVKAVILSCVDVYEPTHSPARCDAPGEALSPLNPERISGT